MSNQVSFEQFNYCSFCGIKLNRKNKNCPNCGFKRYDSDPYNGIPKVGSVGPGWSNKINDPAFAKYQKNQRKVAIIIYPILVLIIAIVLILTGQISLQGQGLYVIGGIATVFMLFCVFWNMKTKSHGKTFEGTVENKQIKKRTKTYYDKVYGTSKVVTHLDTIITIRSKGGRAEDIVFIDDNKYYNYLNIGDYICNHQTKDFRYIEKYDKSNDSMLFCAACNYPNDIRGNFCQCCGCPLIK